MIEGLDGLRDLASCQEHPPQSKIAFRLLPAFQTLAFKHLPIGPFGLVELAPTECQMRLHHPEVERAGLLLLSQGEILLRQLNIPTIQGDRRHPLKIERTLPLKAAEGFLSFRQLPGVNQIEPLPGKSFSSRPLTPQVAKDKSCDGNEEDRGNREEHFLA